MEDAQIKIADAIKTYTKLFPDEFARFKTSVRAKQENLTTKWAEVEGSEAIERHLFDMPEKLYTAIKIQLTQDELDWLFATGRHRKDFTGVKWFMTTYKDFLITEDF